jgi:hypothetical protein
VNELSAELFNQSTPQFVYDPGTPGYATGFPPCVVGPQLIGWIGPNGFAALLGCPAGFQSCKLGELGVRLPFDVSNDELCKTALAAPTNSATAPAVTQIQNRKSQRLRRLPVGPITLRAMKLASPPPC